MEESNTSGGNAELRELCDRFPDFAVEDWQDDEEWLLSRLRARSLPGFTQSQFDRLAGKIVAVYKRDVVGIGDDEVALRIRLSKQHEVHPGRFVLRIIGKRSFFKSLVVSSALIWLVIFVGISVLFIAAVSGLGTKANATFSRIGTVR